MTKPVKISAMLFFILIISTLSGCVQQINNEKQNEFPYTPQQPALETLDNYDWDKGLPSWDVLNNTASNFTRITGIGFMKSAVPTGLFVDDPSMPINESLIEENLAVKDRLHANVYEVRLSFIYKDGGFYPPGPEDVKTNVFLRSIMTDGVLAKKTGLAVHLTAGFFPENGFKNLDELYNALDKWEEIINKTAAFAEQYKFEYFNPFGELDHVIRMDSNLDLPENTIVEIFNTYHPRYAKTVRNWFNGKIVTQLGDVYPALKNSILSYNLSNVDIIGILTGSKLSEFNENLYRIDMMENIGIMRDLCEKYNKSWYISEAWFWDEKPVTQEKLMQQVTCFETLFDLINSTNKTLNRGPFGLFIMNWNLDEEDIFADIIDRPAENVVAKFFNQQ